MVYTTRLKAARPRISHPAAQFPGFWSMECVRALSAAPVREKLCHGLDPGALDRPAGQRRPQGTALFLQGVDRQIDRHALPVDFQHRHDPLLVATEVALIVDTVGDVAAQKK